MEKLYLNAIDIVNEMNECKDNEVGYLAMYLQDKYIKTMVDKFIHMSKREVNTTILDIIEYVIIHSKTVYESVKYKNPFDDETYDKMLSRFKKFRAEPFGNNGTGLANAEYKYDNLSGTLDKVHFIFGDKRTENDMRGSLDEYIMDLPVKMDYKLWVLVNQKKDGTSVTIDYKLKHNYDKSEYFAVSAISRGKKDHGEGTDVSAVMPTCGFSTKEIEIILGYCPDYIGIQYEMVISNEDMNEFSKYCRTSFANNRSAVAGLMRRLIFASDSERNELKRFVSLVPVGFDILSEYIKNREAFEKIRYSDLYEAISKTFIFGSVDMEYDIISGTKNEIMTQFVSIAESQLKNRRKLNNTIDGLVLTILNDKLRKKLGRSNNINKWQIAYKFPEEEKKTRIIGYDITTGNFGYKEIILLVDPVNLNGTIQGKAQVHSLNKFKKMDLRIGDEIILKLSGDVIPFGYKDSSCHPGIGKKIKLPKICDCGAPLEEEKNKLRCINSKCPYRTVGSMVTFFKELNAKGIGQQTCKLLYDELGISTPSDILNLTMDDFKKLPGFQEKSAKLAMNTLKEVMTKPRTIASILSAIGIDSFRTSTASKLMEIVTIDELIEICELGDKDAVTELLRKSDGIDLTAGIIADGLISNIKEIKKLLGYMTIKNDVRRSYDKSILISGMRNDDELTSIANAAGFEVKDSGKKYDILVVRNSDYLTKSKALNANEKGIPIMTRDMFIKTYKI